MCGRVNVTDYASIDRLMADMDITINLTADIVLSDKLFPYYKPLVAGFVDEQGNKDSALMNWGWHRDWDKGKHLFNSCRVSKKGQIISHSPVWGDAIRQRRCLIPINAFYEWNENQPKGKRDRYRIETHNKALALGGIYEISQEGEMFLSICTTEPNKLMAEIHHRMPVIIDREEAEQWLYSDNLYEIDRLMQAKSEDYIILNKEQQVGKTQGMF